MALSVSLTILIQIFQTYDKTLSTRVDHPKTIKPPTFHRPNGTHQTERKLPLWLRAVHCRVNLACTVSGMLKSESSPLTWYNTSLALLLLDLPEGWWCRRIYQSRRRCQKLGHQRCREFEVSLLIQWFPFDMPSQHIWILSVYNAVLNRGTPDERTASSERNFCKRCSSMLWLYDKQWWSNLIH